MPSRFEVRQVRCDEWCAIKDVRLAMLRDSPRAFATTITEALAHDDQVWIDRAAAGALGEAQWTVLAFDSETPIGMGVGLRRARFGKPILVVVSVFLAESFRGTGVTDEMFRQIEEWGCSWGAMYASLWVGDENARAAAFYRRSGYAITLDRAKLPNNSGLWETRLEKALMSPT